MHQITRPLELCPRFHHAVELVGRRWTGAILQVMLSGVTRFSDLRECVPDLSDRMLSERLKELEREGIVVRTVVPATPVRIDYRLTDKGRALGSVMTAIGSWATEWITLEELGAAALASSAPCAEGLTGDTNKVAQVAVPQDDSLVHVSR